MGKVKQHLEGRNKAERIRIRKDLGPLKNLTVQPQTRKRYETARKDFYQFIADNNLRIPERTYDLDVLLGDYLEHLWSSGEGRGKASDTLAAIQDLQPHTKGGLPLSWRLLKAWHVNEIPCRAPPLPEICLQAMLGWCIFKEEFKFGLSLLVGFYGLLRTGEILDLKASSFFIESSSRPAVVSLGFTKGGKRMGAAESITIGVELVLVWLKLWKAKSTAQESLCYSSSQWRAKFAECLSSVGLEPLGFRPYSLRRGGATYWFSKSGSLDRVVVLGRWAAQKTARICINEGMATLAEMAVPRVHLRPYLTLFKLHSRKPRFAWAHILCSLGGRGVRSILRKDLPNFILFNNLRLGSSWFGGLDS